MFEEIYKRNVDGKVQVWKKVVDGDKHKTVTAKADLVAGKLIYGKFSESKWTTAKPKNVGKKNETTGDVQAIMECQSEYTKKLKVGYAERLEDIDTVVYNSPMLAKTFEDYKKGFPKYVYSQPKLDGCVSKDGKVVTEQGERTVEQVYNGTDSLMLSFNTKTGKPEFKKINGKFKNETNTKQSKRWLKITLEDGSSFKVTDNHRIYLPHLDVWREAKDLLEGDDLLSA